MRVALVIYRADASRGGAERYTLDLAAALAGRGCDVAVLAAKFGKAAENLRQIRLPAGGVTRAGQYTRFLASLQAALGAGHFDIVHAALPVRACHVYHPHAGLALEVRLSGHLQHAPGPARAMSWLGNRLNRKRLLYARVEREMMRWPRPPVVLCLSNRMRELARSRFPIDSRRLIVLRNGVDLARFDRNLRPDAGAEARRRLRLDPDRVIALFVAQNFALKGLGESIRALGRIGQKRLAIVVVGGDDPTPYQRLAKSLQVAEQVIFAGASDDPYEFYHAADWLLLPSRQDSFGLAAVEAMAMGLPVVISRQAGAHEIIQHGAQGLIVDDPGNIESLAEAMRQLLDEQLRRGMADACMALRPQLSYERHVDRIIEVYQRVMAESAHSRSPQAGTHA